MAKKAKPEIEAEQPDEVESATGIIIQVSDDWRMKFDGIQFCIQHRRVSKEGKTKGTIFWDNEAFCRELGNAIMWLANRRLYCIPGTYGIEGLDLLTSAVDEIKAEMKKALAVTLKKVANEVG